MRIQVGTRVFEIGSGHELFEIHIRFDEHGLAQRLIADQRLVIKGSISRTKIVPVWSVTSDGQEQGDMPVGVYEITNES